MAGKTAIKPKVKKEEPKISMTYIDDILLRLDKAEDDVDSVLSALDGLDLRVEKVESRLGLG